MNIVIIKIVVYYYLMKGVFDMFNEFLNKIDDSISQSIEKIITGESYVERQEKLLRDEENKNIGKPKTISSVYPSKEIQDKAETCMQELAFQKKLTKRN